MTVAIVIPTVQGREEDLARCLLAYEDNSAGVEIHLYVEHDHSNCGQAWIAGAEKAAQDGFDYLHLTADDLKPHEGWADVAIETVSKGYIPAPLVYEPDGMLQSAGLAGFGCYIGPYTDWGFVEGTTVPFLTREMWERIGMVPLHYCTDLWVSARGRQYGWETVVRTGMAFTHYNAVPSRNQGRAQSDAQEYLRLLATS